MTITQPAVLPPMLASGDIVERTEDGHIIISPANRSVTRRLIYLDNYGGRVVWNKIKSGDMPPHHLRGCLELACMGYEVLLAEPLPDFYLRKNAFPHDLRLLKYVRHWLGRDGLLFCGHNVLYWLPLLKRLGVVKCRIVSNLFAREPLDFAGVHSGILGLTGAAVEQARKLAPKVKIAHLGWGADLSIYPRLPYNPEAFFSCGIAHRDFKTMSLAATQTQQPMRVVCPGDIPGVTWPAHVQAINSGKGWNFEKKRLSYRELLDDYYANSTASLIIVRPDPEECLAPGFTEILEALAMSRPIIMTRTGALPTEIDVEKEDCGVFVPPEDPIALAAAMEDIAANPARAREMGANGRRLAERRYNIGRYAHDLGRFFASL